MIAERRKSRDAIRANRAAAILDAPHCLILLRRLYFKVLNLISSLFVMIGLAPYYCEGSVELLHKD